MVKTVTSIQVTANDTVAFYNGTDVVMTLSQIMPPSVYIDYSNTSIVIYNQANSSDEKTKFEFPVVYVQQVGANSYTKLNSYALQTEITARVLQVYKDLTTQIFKGCCEAGGCQADGCSILYRYNSELNEGDWYYDSEGGILSVSMNSFSNQLFDSLLPAMPIDSWVTFISSADSTLYAVFQITNAGTIVGGYVEYEATLVDGSSTFPVNTVFCFNLMAAGGSPVIGITSGNAGITVGGSYPSYTISNAMTVSAGAGITITGPYPNYTITSNAAGVTLTSAGGTESLVNDGTGPTLAIKGITAGSGITLSSTGTALTISSTGASGVTSVGLSMPPAFTVTNSPVTSTGTLTATANGTSSQYIDGTGSLQTFPSPQGLQSVITTNNNLTTTNTIIGNGNSLTWSDNNKFEIFPDASGYFLVTVGKYPPNESQIKVTALTSEMFTTAATTQKFKTDSTTLYIQTPNVSNGSASAGQVLTLGNATTGAVEYTTITSNPGTVTSVSASVPSPTSPALSVNVTNPTSTPNIAITANGTSSQFIDGTGALQTIPSSDVPFAIASGTDTYTATVTGATAYADGDAYIIRFTNGNTNQSTLDIYNGTSFLGAKTLYKNNDGPLIGGDIWDGGEMICIYNSANDAFSCIGTSPNTLFAYVTNDQGSTITRGQAVYAFGGTGNRMTVKLAQANTDATSAQTIGFVFSTSIAANQKGIIIIQGYFTGLSLFPTATWADGDPVYLSPTTAGAVTKTKPYAPDHLVYLGVVASANNGSSGRMYVRVQNGYELDELHNVQAQSPSLNDTLWYDSSVSPGQWKTASIPTILGYTPVTNARTISTTSPLSGGGDLSANRTLSITQATTTTDGYLSSTDWNTFNAGNNSNKLFLFGDSSTATGTTTINSPIVLSEDRYYYNLTLASGGSIDLNGWRLFVQNNLDLTNAGASAIHNNGSAGANGLGTGGATNGGANNNVGRSGKGRSVYGGVANSNSGTTGVHLGGNGGAGGSANTNGIAGLQSTAPSNYQIRIGGAGGNGGKGGNSSVATGGAGGSGQIQAPTIVLTAAECVIRIPQVYGFWNVQNFDGTTLNTNTIYGGRNGGGGGGGAGSSTNGARQGGCGGGGGGNCFVFAFNIIVAVTTNASAISSNGGNGGNGALADNLNCGGGGGAGAGGGGYVFVLCNSISTNGIQFISANGGTGGTGGNGNGTGIGGNGGIGGVGGRITIIRLKDGTITQVDGTSGTPSTPATPTNTIGSAGSSGTTATYTS